MSGTQLSRSRTEGVGERDRAEVGTGVAVARTEMAPYRPKQKRKKHLFSTICTRKAGHRNADLGGRSSCHRPTRLVAPYATSVPGIAQCAHSTVHRVAPVSTGHRVARA
eukprot:853588-Rhodomonas_salina.1